MFVPHYIDGQRNVAGGIRIIYAVEVARVFTGASQGREKSEERQQNALKVHG